jgi:hypothetical protein
MTVSLTDLNQLGFFASHQITLGAGDVPRFIALKGGSGSASPAVYVWVAHKSGDEAAEVLYVGKAGKGVKRRLVQHQNGFKRGTGRKNAAALRRVIRDQDLSVTVMARVSESATLFSKTVSMYAAEENALCELLAPKLNRAVFPELAGNVETAKSEEAGSLPGLEQSSRSDVTPARGANAGRLRIPELINSRLVVQDEGTEDDMLQQVGSYGADELFRLKGLLEFLEARVLAPDHVLKISGGYRYQPKGCDGVTTLGFGRLAGQRFARQSWVARIYLTDTPRVAFPLKMLNPAQRDRVEVKDGLFAPLDLEAFLRDPDSFVQAE